MALGALVVDIDNTLAINPGPFGPLTAEELKERLLASGLGDDPVGDSPGHLAEARRIASLEPIEAVCAEVRRLGADLPVWYLSARPEWLREATLRWLDLHGLGEQGLPGFRALLLRPHGDLRPTEEVKVEIFQTAIAPCLRTPMHDVALIDDRPEIRALFSAMGLTVLDPADQG